VCRKPVQRRDYRGDSAEISSALRQVEARPCAAGHRGEVKILTSCPSCLQGLKRYNDDTETDADYIVIEIARNLLGSEWLPEYVRRANTGGIERVLV